MTERAKKAIDRSLEEFREFADGKVMASRMYLGAFGLTLIHRFSKLDREDYKSFIVLVYETNDEKSHLINEALRNAAVNDEEAKIRKQMYYDSNEAFRSWLHQNFGKKTDP